MYVFVFYIIVVSEYAIKPYRIGFSEISFSKFVYMNQNTLLM